jgi:hypothetical protein
MRNVMIFCIGKPFCGDLVNTLMTNDQQVVRGRQKVAKILVKKSGM